MSGTKHQIYILQPQQVYQYIILFMLSIQNILFAKNNEASDHTQWFILDEKQNSPNLFARKL